MNAPRVGDWIRLGSREGRVAHVMANGRLHYDTAVAHSGICLAGAVDDATILRRPLRVGDVIYDRVAGAVAVTSIEERGVYAESSGGVYWVSSIGLLEQTHHDGTPIDVDYTFSPEWQEQCARELSDAVEKYEVPQFTEDGELKSHFKVGDRVRVISNDEWNKRIGSVARITECATVVNLDGRNSPVAFFEQHLEHVHEGPDPLPNWAGSKITAEWPSHGYDEHDTREWIEQTMRSDDWKNAPSRDSDCVEPRRGFRVDPLPMARALHDLHHAREAMLTAEWREDIAERVLSDKWEAADKSEWINKARAILSRMGKR